MQEKDLFEYAVIRIVPRVEREEFLNVGVVLYCSGQKFLQSLFELDNQRLHLFCASLDMQELHQNLTALQQICKGGTGTGPIGQLDIASRFRWLTATRSTIVQSSKVHAGFCISAAQTLQHLYDQLVK